MIQKQVIFSEYMQYRAHLRDFELNVIEQIVRYSEERYFDTVTHSPTDSISSANREIDIMRKTEMTYFQQDDMIHLMFSSDHEVNSVELSPNITAELNEHGEVIGIEILEASSFLRDMILETAQVKLLTAMPMPTHASFRAAGVAA